MKELDTFSQHTVLLPMVEQVLAEKGLSLKLEDVVFVQGTSAVESEKERKFELSEEMEEELLDAIARYLKMLLKNSVSECNMTSKNQVGTLKQE